MDPLTGLLTREPFLNELRDKIRGLTANQGWLYLVFIDLDKFKPINDVYGHDADDRVLSQIGERLLSKMSPKKVDLTLEIIESPHFRDHDRAFSALQLAREMGAQVVLDHFGSGTSSTILVRRGGPERPAV
ncbi:MAG: diguanylate cyclase [Spirochaetaceae bacterium]|nr:MAG: diguanylate cyclase [Spirochaetaceae bacterium]